MLRHALYWICRAKLAESIRDHERVVCMVEQASSFSAQVLQASKVLSVLLLSYEMHLQFMVFHFLIPRSELWIKDESDCFYCIVLLIYACLQPYNQWRHQDSKSVCRQYFFQGQAIFLHAQNTKNGNLKRKLIINQLRSSCRYEVTVSNSNGLFQKRSIPKHERNWK